MVAHKPSPTHPPAQKPIALANKEHPLQLRSGYTPLLLHILLRALIEAQHLAISSTLRAGILTNVILQSVPILLIRLLHTDTMDSAGPRRRRRHTRSRAGCLNCKACHVRCTEEKPTW
jgi:hypothetical protein